MRVERGGTTVETNPCRYQDDFLSAIAALEKLMDAMEHKLQTPPYANPAGRCCKLSPLLSTDASVATVSHIT